MLSAFFALECPIVEPKLYRAGRYGAGANTPGTLVMVAKPAKPVLVMM